MDAGSGRAGLPADFRFRLKTQHQFASDLTAPLFDSSLESAQLSGRERAGRAFLQTDEQLFGIGVGLFVEPQLNLRPGCFKWVHTSAIGPWRV